MAAPRSQTLPVFLLIRSAYQFLWQRHDDALRLAFIPTMVAFGAFAFAEDAMVSIVSQVMAGKQDQLASGDQATVIVVAIIVLLAMAVLAVNWMRYALLGPMGAVGLGLAIGRPHMAFIVWSAALLFGASIALTVLSMPLQLLPPLIASIGVVVVFIIVLVGIARLTPFVVGQAIGQPISLQQAWAATRGNGVPLATAMILVQLPLWIVLVLLGDLLGAIGFAQVAPLAMLFIGIVFQAAGFIIQATVLSTAFRQLIGIKV